MDDSVLAQGGCLRQRRMAMACSKAALRLSCPSRWNESELTPLLVPDAPGQTTLGFLSAILFLLSLPHIFHSFSLSFRLCASLSTNLDFTSHPLRYQKKGTTAYSMWLLELYGSVGRLWCLQSLCNEFLPVLVKKSTKTQSMSLKLFWILVCNVADVVYHRRRVKTL